MKRAIVIALLLVPATAFAIKPRIPNENNPATNSPMTEGEEGSAGASPAEDPSRHFNFFNFGYRGKDELGGAYGDGKMEETDPKTGAVIRVVHEEEPMSPPFVLMLVNFGLFLIILAKYGWPFAGKLARDRHDQIKSALDEAAQLRDTAKAKLVEYETRVAGLDGEIRKLVDGIRADADADKARILKAADAQATQMKRDAELRIAAEIEMARATLTREITAAAAAATEKLLRANVTTADQSKLVGSFITNLEKH